MDSSDSFRRIMNNELGIKAVIFDLDGLLIDSEPVWDKAYKVLCKVHKITPENNIAQITLGMGLRECIEVYKKRLGLRGDTTKLLKEYRDIFYGLALSDGNLRLLEGVRELLKSCKNNQLAVATGGHTSKAAFDLLKKSQIDSFFEKVVSSDDVSKGKPDPEIYLFTASRISVNPRNCLVLEDAPNGVLAGKRAGMKVFGVNKDRKIKEDLEKSGADKVFSSLLEVKEYI